MSTSMIPSAAAVQTYQAIRGNIITAQNKVSAAVNTAMVEAYWLTGEQIHLACGESDRHSAACAAHPQCDRKSA